LLKATCERGRGGSAHSRARVGSSRSASRPWYELKFRYATALLAFAVLCFARVAAAQIGVGVLEGRVTDASSHQPLKDVVVTATSPAMQGEQTVVTDPSGTFRIPELPPGEYELRYEIDGYRAYTRNGIELRTGITLRVDADLLPSSVRAEEVTVVPRAPTVDVGSARSGVTIDSDFTSRIAIAPPTGKGGAARSFEQVAEVAPGAHGDLYGESIAGTTSVENVYLVDGLSVGNPGFGYNGSPLSIEFIKETNVVTGGYLPEYGRGGGGVLDAVTKSGSNEFHGSFFGNWTPFSATPKFIQAQQAISTNAQLDSTRDMGFDLGGPIVKDKLWFYAGADVSELSYKLTRDLNVLNVDANGNYVYDNNGLIESSPIAGTRRISYATQTGLQYIAKLTYSPTSDDRIELIHHGTPTHSGGNGNYSIDYETGLPFVHESALPGSTQTGPYGAMAERQIFDGFDTILKWTHTTSNKNLTFDTSLGWHHEHDADLPADGTNLGGGGLAGTPAFVYRAQTHSITDFENVPNPSVCTPVTVKDPTTGKPVIDPTTMMPVAPTRPCPVVNYEVGGPGFARDNQLDRFTVREVATFVTPGLGHHVFKAGGEFEVLTYAAQKAYTGGVEFRESSSGTSVSDLRSYGGQTGPDAAYRIPVLRFNTLSTSTGGFLQDSWSIMDVVTLNAGLRYDTQQLYADGGQLGLTLANQWSPRLGIIWDPTQTGHAKIFANYAISY
jgi:outer membrane receptor protein involved in Fe transport